MNLQINRIEELCTTLSLAGIAANYEALAQNAIDQDKSYSDFLEECLKTEHLFRQQRTRSMLLKIAGFPVIKQIEEFDFNFAVGAPRKQIEALTSLSFIQRKENIVPGLTKNPLSYVNRSIKLKTFLN